ncbi:hypothetical protein ACTU3I_00955 [Microbacterium sp. RD1]|uniref:hypothetical protein n=1 Tax=Microbacterium sp. RD1 TaxID=3457313 RepID=UPI003FA545B3
MTRRRLLTPIVAVATFVALASGGAAAAAWIASASVNATASSATVATTLAQSGNLATTYRYTGTTSTSASGSLVLTNTGRTPLTYTLAAQTTGHATLAQKTALSLWTGTCGTTVPATGAVTTTLADAAPALPAAARTIAPGASATVCLATRITGADASASNAALQGQSITVAFTATGSAGANWKAAASAPAFTQSVYRVGSAGAVSCSANWWSRGVTLSWPAPANRVAGSPVAYRVVDTRTGGEIAAVTVDAGTASVSFDGYAIAQNGTHALAVEARDTVSGSISAVNPTIAITRTTPWNLGVLFPTLQCP